MPSVITAQVNMEPNAESRKMPHAHSFYHGASPALLCPITMELMLDPVIDANGNTFERVAIERALEHKPGICPLSNAEYTAGAARLMPNRAVRNLVDEYLKRTGNACVLSISRILGSIVVACVAPAL